MKTVKKIIAYRKSLFERLMREAGKRASEVDTALCTSLIDEISKSESRIQPMLQRLDYELTRLSVEESHALYQESDKNRKTMKIIDKAARKLIAAARTMAAESMEGQDQISKVYHGISRLTGERSKKTRIGFKP